MSESPFGSEDSAQVEYAAPTKKQGSGWPLVIAGILIVLAGFLWKFISEGTGGEAAVPAETSFVDYIWLIVAGVGIILTWVGLRKRKTS